MFGMLCYVCVQHFLVLGAFILNNPCDSEFHIQTFSIISRSYKYFFSNILIYRLCCEAQAILEKITGILHTIYKGKYFS